VKKFLCVILGVLLMGCSAQAGEDIPVSRNLYKIYDHKEGIVCYIHKVGSWPMSCVKL
jgi:hypothetical protein